MTTPTPDTILEAMADACSTIGAHPNDIRAALQAAEALGYVLVPREPTEAMKLAGEDTTVMHAWSSAGEHVDAESAGHVYSVMIAAAPKVTE